ncbi:MAG: hypothetical protein O2871_01770 [bacterium]|nr:hypothetical protein [bacterium]
MGKEYFVNMGLDTKSLEERKNTIGGSDITTLASGDPERILKLFNQKTNRIERDDLSLVWAVQMGVITEEANIEWTEHFIDLPIIDRQKVFNGKKYPFMRCTVDGVVKGYKNKLAVIDAKFTMGRPKRDEEYKDVIPRLIKYYSPQLHWNAYLIEEETKKKCPYGLLSFIKGGDQPTLHEVKIDPEYQLKLINVAKWFMGCIEMDIEPTDIPTAEAPIPQEDKVPVDMQADPKWKAFAEQYIQTLGANEIFKDAEAKIKKLVPRNASEAFGHGIAVKVAKNNAKRILLCNN